MVNKNRKRVVIIGGGFGGLVAAQSLARLPVDVTVVDRKNHHTFQPLLYQVATAGLSPAEIAAPIREILSRHENVEVLLGQVFGFDLERRLVKLHGFELPYDYVVVAAGASHAYFGHDEWERFAPGLKTIEDALEIRRRVLLAFEMAERHAASTGQHLPLTFVVVGGGPTGVELAGTLAEITRKSLSDDFRNIDPKSTRIVLLEAGPAVLPAYPEDLQLSAKRQLERLGVEVRLNSAVTDVLLGEIHVGAEAVHATIVLWAAGVSASPLGRALGGPVDRAGRVLVDADLSLPGHPEVFVIGDLASLKQAEGTVLPGVAPVAMQQGRWVARQIAADLAGNPRKSFHYIDKGSLATIGRAAAVAQFGKLHISGFLAWMGWLFIHIFFLIGFRNRLIVMIQWAWSYFTYDRSARLITGESGTITVPPLDHAEQSATAGSQHDVSTALALDK
ncbi:MAG TPA: NAD(P)/FAD-dependent oxidoreductase [Candidatus Eisenbacteria bacterium]|nr:NAD(P)/FAD-dependent oxidoreductase [Candidatus Eisenbacteria bacterium]